MSKRAWAARVQLQIGAGDQALDALVRLVRLAGMLAALGDDGLRTSASSRVGWPRVARKHNSFVARVQWPPPIAGRAVGVGFQPIQAECFVSESPRFDHAQRGGHEWPRCPEKQDAIARRQRLDRHREDVLERLDL